MSGQLRYFLKTFVLSAGRPQFIVRDGLIEGRIGDPSFKGLTINHARPLLTIRLSADQPLVWGRMDEMFGRFEPKAGQRPHTCGMNFKPEGGEFMLVEPAFFAKASLVKQILEAGGTGLAFQPVQVLLP